MTITGNESSDDLKIEIARRIYTGVVLNAALLKVKDVVRIYEVEHFVNILKKRSQWNGIKPFLQHYPCFFLMSDENNYQVIKPIVTVEFCRDFDGKKGCGRTYCSKLHVCRHFVKGKCTFGPRCKKPHHFDNQETREILKKHFLDCLTNEQAREFLCRNVQHLLEPDNLSTELPKSLEICKYYNVATGCTRDFCPFIHVCRFFAEEGNCKFGSQCIRKHDINNVHSRILLHRYHMDHLSDPQVITYLKIKGESRDQQLQNGGVDVQNGQNIKNEKQQQQQPLNGSSNSLTLPPYFPNHFSLPTTASNGFLNDMHGLITDSISRKLSQPTPPMPNGIPIIDEQPQHTRKLSLPNPRTNRPGLIRPPVSVEENSPLMNMHPSSIPNNLYTSHQENRKLNEPMQYANSFTNKVTPEIAFSKLYSHSHGGLLNGYTPTSTVNGNHSKDISKSLKDKFLSYLNDNESNNNNDNEFYKGLGLNNLSPPTNQSFPYNSTKHQLPNNTHVVNNHFIKSKSYENFQKDYLSNERNHSINGYTSKPQSFYKPFSTSLQTDLQSKNGYNRSRFFRTSSSDIISPTGSSSSVNGVNGLTNGLTDSSLFFGSSDWTENNETKNFEDDLNFICYRTRSLPNFNATNLDKIIDKTKIMNLKNQLSNECQCQKNQICVYNLNNDCKIRNCEKLHTDDTFQWQISSFPEQASAFKTKNNTHLNINIYNNNNKNENFDKSPSREWVNIDKNENFKLELAFTSCELEQTDIDYYGDNITIYFEEMVGVSAKNDILNSANHSTTSRSCDLSSWLLQPNDDPISRSGSQENVIYNIRRISTKSTVTEQLDSRFATQWLWYWQDSFGMWREYPRNKNDVIESNVCLSDDIEKKFVEGGDQSVFEEHQMLFDFKTMQQTNTLSRKQKKVRRRTQYIAIEQRNTSENTSISTYVDIKRPYYWSTQVSFNPYAYELQSVDQTSDIYTLVSKHFQQSIDSTACEIVSLKFIQNIELWKLFLRLKAQLVDVNLKVAEKFVFKMASENELSGICQQGFQVCSCEENRDEKSFSVYSKDAVIPSNSTGVDNQLKTGVHYMFCARMSIPEENMVNDQQKLSSEVDSGESSIVCKHTNQVYPEFLIVFNKT